MQNTTTPVPSPSSEKKQRKNLIPVTGQDASEPRPYAIQNILNYSRALKVEKSKYVGIIETVMN
jgi:hypothetical protein